VTGVYAGAESHLGRAKSEPSVRAEELKISSWLAIRKAERIWWAI